jgi:hypothetical protein
MLDTVRFEFNTEPSSRQLRRWHRISKKYSDGREFFKYWRQIRASGGNSIRANYYPQDRDGLPHNYLSIEFSLPKLVIGNNYELLLDPISAIDVVNPILNACPLFPPIDLSKGIIGRIDYCYNHQVGLYVSEYINQLFKLHYPYRRTKPYYPTNGLHFYSIGVTTTFYDKEQECKDPLAYGILRQETRVSDRKKIENIFGKPNPTILDYRPNMAITVLTNDLDELGLNGTSISDSGQACKILIDEYGEEQGLRLFGYYSLSQVKFPDQIVSEYGLSRQKVYRNQTAIKKAHLPLCQLDGQGELPSLSII